MRRVFVDTGGFVALLVRNDATASTRDAVEREMADAISFHLDGLRAEGLEIPSPHPMPTYVDIPA